MRDLLVIMARYPTLGKVKTRLAREIGRAGALRVYRQLLDHHRREFRQTPFDVQWRYTPARAPFRRFVQTLCGSGVPAATGPTLSRRGRRSHSELGLAVRSQPAGDLGERMQRIFEESFARGYRRVVIIGTDAPRMNTATVQRAFRLLRTHPAAFQPTHDGGYALIGLRAFEFHDFQERSFLKKVKLGALFDGVPWGTNRVMARTRRRLRAKRISFAELPVTFDVDTADDLQKMNGVRA